MMLDKLLVTLMIRCWTLYFSSGSVALFDVRKLVVCRIENYNGYGFLLAPLGSTLQGGTF